jgi:hypothetical protein
MGLLAPFEFVCEKYANSEKQDETQLHKGELRLSDAFSAAGA